MTKFHIANSEIERRIDGKPTFVKPGEPVFDLGEDEVEKLLKLGAIREPNKVELELETLRAKSRDEDAGSGKTSRRAKKTDDGNGEDDGKDAI